MFPQVIFRAKGLDEKISFYVAYLFQDPWGRYFAVLSENEDDGYVLPGSPMLDASLLVEQRDETSEEPFYLYRGIVDVRQQGFQTPLAP